MRKNLFIACLSAVATLAFCAVLMGVFVVLGGRLPSFLTPTEPTTIAQPPEIIVQGTPTIAPTTPISTPVPATLVPVTPTDTPTPTVKPPKPATVVAQSTQTWKQVEAKWAGASTEVKNALLEEYRRNTAAWGIGLGDYGLTAARMVIVCENINRDPATVAQTPTIIVKFTCDMGKGNCYIKKPLSGASEPCYGLMWDVASQPSAPAVCCPWDGHRDISEFGTCYGRGCKKTLEEWQQEPQ